VPANSFRHNESSRREPGAGTFAASAHCKCVGATRVRPGYNCLVPRFHHVNLGVPVDGIEQETDWLVDVLGYRRLDAGPELAAMGACWFEADDGSQVHLSGDAEHRAAARAHVAVVFDDLDPVCRRIEGRGDDFTMSEGTGIRVLLCRDPAGNRWELRQHQS